MDGREGSVSYVVLSTIAADGGRVEVVCLDDGQYGLRRGGAVLPPRWSVDELEGCLAALRLSCQGLREGRQWGGGKWAILKSSPASDGPTPHLARKHPAPPAAADQARAGRGTLDALIADANGIRREHEALVRRARAL